MELLKHEKKKKKVPVDPGYGRGVGFKGPFFAVAWGHSRE